MAMRHHDRFSPPHRRESYPRMARNFYPSESYRSSSNFPYLAERYGYSDYIFREERPVFLPYFEADRIPFRREVPVLYHTKYPSPNSIKGPIKFRKSGSRNEDSQLFRRKSQNDVWNVTSLDGVHLPKDDIFVKPERELITVEGILENPNPKHVDSESSILKYCLDRDTQHTIHSLQNDFRYTKKYKSFVMYELPQIPDFRPTPATTINKFHDRFKCLCKELLNENDLNVDFKSNPENSEENKEKENVGSKEKKAVQFEPCSNVIA